MRIVCLEVPYPLCETWMTERRQLAGLGLDKTDARINAVSPHWGFSRNVMGFRVISRAYDEVPEAQEMPIHHAIVKDGEIVGWNPPLAKSHQW